MSRTLVECVQQMRVQVHRQGEMSASDRRRLLFRYTVVDLLSTPLFEGGRVPLRDVLLKVNEKHGEEDFNADEAKSFARTLSQAPHPPFKVTVRGGQMFIRRLV